MTVEKQSAASAFVLQDWISTVRHSWQTLLAGTVLGAALGCLFASLTPTIWNAKVAVQFPDSAPAWVLRGLNSIDTPELRNSLLAELRDKSAAPLKANDLCRIHLFNRAQDLACSGKEHFATLAQQVSDKYLSNLKQWMTRDNQLRRDRIAVIDSVIAGNAPLDILTSPDSPVFLGHQRASLLASAGSDNAIRNQLLCEIKNDIAKNLDSAELAAASLAMQINISPNSHPNYILLTLDGALLGLFFGWMAALFGFNILSFCGPILTAKA